jgi:hypothetical protein
VKAFFDHGEENTLPVTDRVVGWVARRRQEIWTEEEENNFKK